LFEREVILQTEPSFYTKDHVLGKLPVHWNSKLQRFAIDGKLPLYNRWKSYSESTLLILDGCMAGTNGFRLFQYLQFQSTFLLSLREKRSTLPDTYKSLHIRDTDKATKWKDFTPRLEAFCTTDMPIFVAFDTPSVKEKLENLNGKFLFSSSWMPQIVRRNLHYQGITNAQILPDALCDMCLLALGADFLESCPSSGYSQYIRMLRDSPSLLHNLTGL
jgi:hypothetical protein